MRLSILALVAGLVLPAAYATAVRADDAPAPAAAAQPEHVLGKADAPITIIEYASLTCPHCAHFDAEVLPQVKTAYIDTGKAKLVFRDFPLDGIAVKAAMLARCMPEDRYFPFLDALFKSQASWAYVKDPLAALGRLGKLAGLSQETADKCLADPALERAVLEQRLSGSKDFNVDSTPTLIVNGKKVGAVGTFEEFDQVLKPLASGS
jgi:protein-disulfide isomerase